MDSHKNLPQISGVPAEHVPYFVQALKSCSKYFQKCTQTIYTMKNHEQYKQGGSGSTNAGGNSSSSSLVSNNVHDFVMDRVAVAVARSEQEQLTGGTLPSQSLESILAERQRSMEMSISRWIESLKRYAPRKEKRVDVTSDDGGREQQQQQQQHNSEGSIQRAFSNVNTDDTPRSVPFSMFLYLWEMTTTHERVAVQRSALLLCSMMLQKSRDCRFHLEQDTVLMEWINGIIARKTRWKNPESARIQLPLLQREAYYMLSRLISDGHADRYPKIAVAAARLRHQCPNSTKALDGMSAQNNNMTEYRRLRDVALLYGEKELGALRKLFVRSNQYLETLVPRLTTTAKTSTSNNNGNDNIKDGLGMKDHDIHPSDNENDDDEESIDWEDGDDFEDDYSIGNNTKNIDSQQKDMEDRILHVSAVDRTIATMQSTLHNRQEIEIDFSKSRNESNDSSIPDAEREATSNNDDNDVQRQRKNIAKQKLRTCVQKLSNVHLPRLTAWLDGLRNSDNLTIEKSGSLVLLSSENIGKKVEYIDLFSDFKQEVSRILAASSRLEISHQRTDNNNNNNQSQMTLDHPAGNDQGQSPTTQEDDDGDMRLNLSSTGAKLQGTKNRNVNVRIGNVIYSQKTKKRRTAGKRSKTIQIKCIRR